MSENKEIHELDPKKSLENGVVLEVVNRHVKALDAIQEMAANLENLAKKHQNGDIPTKAGLLAEEWHKGTFNRSAAIQGRTDLTAQIGKPYDPKVDIEILQNGKVVEKAQVKYLNNAQKTTFELSKPEYDGLQKIHPSDQNVKELALRRNESGIHQRNYPDTVENATPKASYDSVESESLSYPEATSLATNASAAAKEVVQREMLGAVKGGAVLGAAISGGVSAVVNTRDLIQGNKEIIEAAKDFAVDTTIGTVDGAVKGAATVVVKSALVRAGAQTVARSSAPVAIAITAVDVIKDIGSTAKGDIRPEELATRTAKNVVQGTGAWAGMEGGAIIGTAIFPGVGTVVGGIVGGVAGHLGASALASFVASKFPKKKRFSKPSSSEAKISGVFSGQKNDGA